jgi:hypothetical protein
MARFSCILVLLEDYPAVGCGGVGLIETDRITECIYLLGAIAGKASDSIEKVLLVRDGTVVRVLLGSIQPFKGGLLLLVVRLRLTLLAVDEVDLDGAVSVDGAGLDLKLVDVHDGGLQLLLSALLFRSVRQLTGGRLPLEGFLPG